MAGAIFNSGCIGTIYMRPKDRDFFLANVENIIFSCASLAWGIWLLVPWFGVPMTAAIANPVQSIIPVMLIGLLFITSGLLKIVGIFLTNTKLLPLGGFLGFILWTFAWLLVLSINVPSALVVLAPFLAVWNAWLYIRYRLGA